MGVKWLEERLTMPAHPTCRIRGWSSRKTRFILGVQQDLARFGIDINEAPTRFAMLTVMPLSWSVLTTATRPTDPRVRLWRLRGTVKRKSHHQG